VLRAGPADRRSAAADLESAWSSSGESHYHSFEQTSESARSYSRPCSSDVELLVAAAAGTAGSSEYESALTSLTSHSSGHLASVEVSSEASETLVPSALELERDMEGAELDAVVEPYDTHIPAAVIRGERPPHHAAPAPLPPHAHAHARAEGAPPRPRRRARATATTTTQRDDDGRRRTM
ncbi:Uncharacterized protein GBIM_17755, partial [Gryllus bimaculatus]